MELRRSEIWRYLGYRGKTPGEREQREIERVALNMQRYIVPRHIYSQKPCVVFADRVQIEGVIFQSRMLARALASLEIRNRLDIEAAIPFMVKTAILI